ncbi:PTS sugar transporter subunit IIC [Oscillospiraceae bacterium NSJ-64]|uniref:PTS sugar transporter subunit IIC n=2 Tax=Youxingia wuxianensis TaxID=2763678 RepID=A0A926ENL8_9FIRM|nr:PTS sugar transporter subunit IIC [Youxingia wuxianensis]
MSAMALGLFSSLIIGLVISQISKIPGLGFLDVVSEVLGASSPVVGGAIGAAIAWGLKARPLVIFSSVACGAVGYAAGGPVGAFVAAIMGSEIGSLVAGRTGVDIVLTPIVTIVSGGLVGDFVGPYVQNFMQFLGNVVNQATEMSPLPMGIIVSVVVGMALTAPISSAALCIMLDLSGLAAGAATVGCCAQMVGFAVAGFRENGWGGLISVGLGTSMLQFSNIMRRPQLWIAPTLAGAILGPVSTCLLKMTNTAAGAGMGTCGLVGQFGTIAAMGDTTGMPVLLGVMAVMHFILPALLTWGFTVFFRKSGWIKDGDMKITVG